jgi:hypothetical protein
VPCVGDVLLYELDFFHVEFFLVQGVEVDPERVYHEEVGVVGGGLEPVKEEDAGRLLLPLLPELQLDFPRELRRAELQIEDVDSVGVRLDCDLGEVLVPGSHGEDLVARASARWLTLSVCGNRRSLPSSGRSSRPEKPGS